MVDREKEEVRKWLREERDRLKKELEQMGEEKEGRGSMREEIAELSVVDNHPADVGSEYFEKSKDLSLKENKMYILQRVEAALAKIDGGTYGICERCGDSISLERLKAVPYTLFCYPCQREEDEGFYCDRPVEEDVLKNPFVKDRLEADNRQDSEDFWQEIARHNKRPRIFEDGVVEEETGISDRLDRVSNREYRDQLPE